MDNGQLVKLICNNDVISLNEADVSKRMMVFDLETGKEIQELLKQPVKAISIPTSNKGTVVVNLLTKDQGLIRSGIMLAQKK
jgi:aspartate oxidase